MAKSDTHLTPKGRYYIKMRWGPGDSRSEIARSEAIRLNIEKFRRLTLRGGLRKMTKSILPCA